jgi:hypothetical protein
LGSIGFCRSLMYESLWICHRWDFFGYIRGVHLHFLFLFLSFLSLRNVFCTYAVYHYTILFPSSLLKKTTVCCPLVPLTFTDARVPQNTYCKFLHRPLLPPSYSAEYSLLTLLRGVYSYRRCQLQKKMLCSSSLACRLDISAEC